MQLTVTLLAGSVILLRLNQSLAVTGSYAAGMTLMAAICFRLLRERWYLIVTLLHCSVAIVAVCGASFWLLSTARMESGMRQVLFGSLSFLTAVLISILKSNAGRRLRLLFRIWRRFLNSWLSITTEVKDDCTTMSNHTAPGHA